MLTTKQFTLLLLCAILSAAFTAFLVIGIFSGDFTFAALNLIIIVTLFAGLIVFSRDPVKKQSRIGDVHIGGKLNPEFEDSEK